MTHKCATVFTQKTSIHEEPGSCYNPRVFAGAPKQPRYPQKEAALKRIVIFDLAEVLNRGIPGVEETLSRVFAVPAETVLPGIAGEIMDDYCRGRMTEEEFWSRTCARNAWQGDLDSARKSLRDNMLLKIPGTEELLRELAARGQQTFLLSDHGREWIDDLLEAHDFFNVFERRFFSFELGSIKRERITFEKVLAKLGSPAPGSVTFVDDALANVEMARSTGIDAVQFTSADELRRELADRSLL